MHPDLFTAGRLGCQFDISPPALLRCHADAGKMTNTGIGRPTPDDNCQPAARSGFPRPQTLLQIRHHGGQFADRPFAQTLCGIRLFAEKLLE